MPFASDETMRALSLWNFVIQIDRRNLHELMAPTYNITHTVAKNLKKLQF